MRKVFIYLESVVCALGLITACNNNQMENAGGGKTTQEEEIVYNDKIQNTFFGVPFGASKNGLMEGFAKQGFSINRYSTDSRLSFHRWDSDRFSFGGLNWTFLHAYLANDYFYSIEFHNAHKTKEAAMSNFNNVLSAISSKYEMFEDPIDDTTIYSRFVGLTKENQYIIVSCYSYESVSHERCIGVTLSYGDNNFNAISDEL